MPVKLELGEQQEQHQAHRAEGKLAHESSCKEQPDVAALTRVSRGAEIVICFEVIGSIS